MKKILCLIIAIVLMLTCVGCGGATVETEQDAFTSMFVMVENNYAWDVVYHRDTKVMYAISRGSYNQGTFTVMLDADGNPLLWEN